SQPLPHSRAASWYDVTSYPTPCRPTRALPLTPPAPEGGSSVRTGGPAKGGGESSSSRWEHLEAQPAAVRAHAVIGAEDAEIRQRLSQEQGAGEVQRVQRSDGLHGKRSLRALGDLPRQLENRPTSPGLGEDLQHGGAAHLVEQLLGDGVPDHPSRL